MVGNILRHIGINQFPPPIRLGMGVFLFHPHRRRMPRRASSAAGIIVGLLVDWILPILVLMILVVIVSTL